jgi:hypothetical protein
MRILSKRMVAVGLEPASFQLPSERSTADLHPLGNQTYVKF